MALHCKQGVVFLCLYNTLLRLGVIVNSTMWSYFLELSFMLVACLDPHCVDGSREWSSVCFHLSKPVSGESSFLLQERKYCSLNLVWSGKRGDKCLLSNCNFNSIGKQKAQSKPHSGCAQWRSLEKVQASYWRCWRQMNGNVAVGSGDMLRIAVLVTN